MADLYFKDAVEVRNSLTTRQKKQIRKLYNEWAREVKSQAKSLSKVPGSINEQRELTRLYYELRQASRVLSSELNNTITSNIREMADVTVRVNKRWLTKLGFTPESVDFKFSGYKDTIIRNILTGNIYQGGYDLSTRVWNLTDSNMSDIYRVIARGIAQNKSVYDISKDLEKYINPNARLPIMVNVNGKPNIIHNMQVDYNAQRLARTTIQHTYQQALVALTKDNPFVDGYIWHAAGNHPCPLCSDRDGNIYTADTIPLDHPNGQCEIEPRIDMTESLKELSEALVNPGEYPDIQSFLYGLDID